MRGPLSCAFAIALSACAADSGTAPLDPPAPAGGQQLATDTIHLAPGQETYWCYQFYSPDEVVGITKVQILSAPGVHHMAIFQTFGQKEDDAPHECNTLIKETWMPIYANGTGSPVIELPTGTGFIIQPHTQYVVQLHLQNPSDKPIDIRAGANFTYDRNTTALQPAGIYALGAFTVNIPPQTLDYQIPVDCTPGKTMNVFALFPHMHKIGTKLDVQQTNTSTSFYTIDPWVFGDQPVAQVTKTIHPEDSFHLTCHYDNRGDTTVTFGESSDNEMCFFVMFYYPFTGLDGCINS
jgi:copper type II ascorbate-dependent monooxygenase-like protein